MTKMRSSSFAPALLQAKCSVGCSGLAVDVGAHERHVEIVARVGEIVGVAAEEGHLALGRHDQAYIGVAAEAVELVLAAAIEGDDLAEGVGVGGDAGLLDLADRHGLEPGRLGGSSLADGVLHTRRDVRDLLQLVEIDGLALPFIGHARGDEAVAEQVLAFLVDTLDALAGAVVIGHHQALARHEGGRAVAGIAQCGEPGVIEPAGGGREAEALVPVVEWRDVELPHLAGFEAGVLAARGGLLGRGWCGKGEHERDERERRTELHCGVTSRGSVGGRSKSVARRRAPQSLPA